MSETFTTVPFRYRARLTLARRVPTDAKDAQLNRGQPVATMMTLEGTLHPDPYNFDGARFEVEQQLLPLRELGWRINSLIVSSYGEKDV